MKTSKYATYVQLWLQTITDCKLKYNLIDLHSYIRITSATIKEALIELAAKGYIKMDGNHNLEILKKIKYPKYMNLPISNNMKEQLSLIYSISSEIGEDVMQSACVEVAVLKRKGGDKLASNTVDKIYRALRKECNITPSMDLFAEDVCDCKGLTSIVPEKKRRTKEELDESIDEVEHDVDDLKSIILKLTEQIDIMNKQISGMIKIMTDTDVLKNTKERGTQELIDFLKRSVKA